MNILTLNCGSSSLKACLFFSDGNRIDQHYQFGQNKSEQAFTAALEKMRAFFSDYQIDAIGHRFVHGGDCEEPARLLDANELNRLQDLAYLAPLHMPANISGVQFCQRHFTAPQFACFDTAFHHSLPESSSRLPVDKKYGLRRYGFHGINYAHIARKLPDLLGDIALKNVLIAHLGSGASLCMLQNLRPVATSMGYSPAGGIPMATRSGDLDPGVMLALAKQMNLEQLSHVTFHQMGLLALSDGESGDMQALLNSDSEQAAFAVDYFCDHVRAAIGAYAAQFGGLDAIVITGGIGEHAVKVRQQIISSLVFIGFALDHRRNTQHKNAIHAEDSKPILIVPADEEAEIALYVKQLHED
ncbi:MAG: hypothetical protein R3341_03780 [Methylophaga sp.]|nr:hypothetical protein [Methylophaga sp.]